MDLTQMDDREAARQLLIRANWDVEEATTLFFGE